MKLKFYLRGLGIGIVFATIVLAVSFHIHNDASQLSESEIISAAKKLGMVFAEDATQTENNTQNTETQNTETRNTESQNTETQNTETQSTETQKAEETQQREPEVKTVTLTITNDVSWRMAGKMLADAGVIKDGNDLYDYYNAHYPDAYLQNGTFEIPSDADLDTIIKILSTKQ